MPRRPVEPDAERQLGKEKALKNQGFPVFGGGQGGIRTRVGILSQTRFPGVQNDAKVAIKTDR
ncbi:protein of unknown function [Thauera humireducens]|nr:protein of unknown function [Thauera humireducens]